MKEACKLMKKLIASALALLAAGMVSAQVHFGIGARGEFGFGLGSTIHSDYETLISLIAGFSSIGTGVNTELDTTVQPFKSFLAGGAVIGRISFDAVPGLFIQPELGFSHNRVGIKQKLTGSQSRKVFGSTIKVELEAESESSVAYNSIDFPILVGYDFEVGSGMVVSPFAGLSLSIPVGSVSSSVGNFSGDVVTYMDGTQYSKEPYKDDDKKSSTGSEDVVVSLNPGAIVGVGFGYKFDQHNMIMGDLRYLLDFTPVKENVDFFGDIGMFTRRGLKLGFNYVYMF